ncbi:MAG: lytic transglycosylase domain-containing protein [Streptosporangiaceae bacterium]
MVSAIHLKVHEKRALTLVKVRRHHSRIQRNKLIGRRLVVRFGWSERHFRCLNRLWMRESGWSARSHNGGSGAHGIPQALPGSKMRSAGTDWRTNPRTQIRWGLRYIKYRYGSPCGAWGHSRATGWY